tara:strand:- start:1099 stop:1290 length:192 start_codon:yes stop_codon:yes gene_type:complete
MKHILFSILAAITFPIAPVLSHGATGNCSEECKNYYCPPEHKKNITNNAKKNTLLKETVADKE